MKKKTVLIVVVALIVIFLIVLFTFKHDYQPYKYFGACTAFTHDCTCFGQLYIGESEPLSYTCKGISFCEDLNVSEQCPN